VAIMFYLGYTNKFLTIWPIFGSANQLLGALSLIAVSVWLAYRQKPTWFTVLPAVFMTATTLRALYHLLVNQYLPTQNWPLIITDIVLMLMSVGVVAVAVGKMLSFRRQAAVSHASAD